MCLFRRLPIRYSIFDIHYSSFPFCLSPFTFRLSYETGVHRKHAEACVYDFVYRVFVFSPVFQFVIHYSIFIILLFPFAFRLSPFAFHMKPAFIVSTPRRASTISYTGFCVFSGVSPIRTYSHRFIRYSIHSLFFFFPFAFRLSPFAFHMKPAFIVSTPRRASTISYTGFCVFSPSPNSIFVIQYSLFFFFPFAFRLSPFAFHMKPAFIVSTPRRVSTISYTGFCVFSPVFKFVIHYSIFIILLFPFAFRLSPFAFPHPFFSINPTPKMYHIAQISLILF